MLGKHLRTRDDILREVVLGQTVESVWLEFKVKVSLKQQSGASWQFDPRREFARDIAGLANGIGGTLVIGVKESASEGYARAEAFTGVEEVEAIRNQIEGSAVRQFLVPSTLGYQVTPIALDDRTTLLALTVDAHADGLVAVWASGAASFVEYPYRTSFGKQYMNPQQAMERLLDTTRRSELKLRRLAASLSAVTIYSAVKVQVEETKAEARARRINAGLPPRSSVPILDRELVWVVKTGVEGVIDDLQESYFTIDLSEGSVPLRVPYSVVFDVWPDLDKRLGLILTVPIACPLGSNAPFIDAGNAIT